MSAFRRRWWKRGFRIDKRWCVNYNSFNIHQTLACLERQGKAIHNYLCINIIKPDLANDSSLPSDRNCLTRLRIIQLNTASEGNKTAIMNGLPVVFVIYERFNVFPKSDSWIAFKCIIFSPLLAARLWIMQIAVLRPGEAFLITEFQCLGWALLWWLSCPGVEWWWWWSSSSSKPRSALKAFVNLWRSGWRCLVLYRIATLNWLDADITARIGNTYDEQSWQC